jgi:hypothetical protein
MKLFTPNRFLVRNFSLICLLLIVLFFSVGKGWGQVATSYIFSATSGTYSTLSGATSITPNDIDDGFFNGIPIGFNFVMNGTNFTHAHVSTNGWMTLGTSSSNNTISSNAATNSLTSLANSPTIAPLWDDLALSSLSGISYVTTGSAPNRIFTIQYNNVKWNYQATNAVMSFQIILNENNNGIQFIYNSLSQAYNAGSTGGASIGIATSSSNYLSLGTNVTTAATVSSSTNTTSITTKPATGITFSFTPPPPCITPTSLAATANSTSNTLSTISGNFTAATTAPTGYIVVRSNSSTQPTAPIAATALPAVGNTSVFGTGTYVEYINASPGSWMSSGLIGSSTYYYYVFSYNNASCIGGPLYSSSATSFSQSTQTCPTFSSTITIGGTTTPGSSYASLTAAIADIKACGITQPTILELSSSYSSSSESFPITLNNITGASSTNTITIRPASNAVGEVITSSNATATIDINGGQYWIIDGRPGGVGLGDLAIGNTGTAPAIRFINDGANNTIQFCSVTSNVTSTSSGLINFSTTTGSIGNDNNTIDNCNLNGGGTAANIIYASGSTSSSAVNNSGVTISNNLISDQFRAASSTNGILVSSGNTDWTISGNSFFQTATRTYTTGSTHSGINISNSSGNNFIINGNFIGGTSASCGGSAMTMTGSGLTQNYNGILLSVGSTTATSVQNNTIKNISFNTSSTGVFNGISITAGNANIGNLTANTIGANTGVGSIVFQTNTTTGPVFTGINSASSGTVAISNNNIGSVNLTTASANTLIANFYGVRATAGTTTTISSNIIGSTITSNSINNTGGQNTTSNASIMRGISYEGSGTVVISSNTVSNMAYSATGGTGPSSAVSLRGIYTTGIATISNNIISNLTNISGNTSTTSSAATIGIVNLSSTSGAWGISQNTIYGLSSSHSTAAVLTTGIFYSGSSTSGIIGRNLIYDLDAGNATATLSGIHIGGGTATYQNNMVRLGTYGTSNTVGMNINGIFEPLGTDNIYHNSVYIGGAPSTGANASYAFNSQQTTNIRNFRNNIFVNARSNNGANSKHYSVRVGGTGTNPTGLTSNYNIYLTTGTGGVLGYFNSADQTTLTGWQTATGQDANSNNANPCLANPTASTPDLHLTDCATAGSPAESSGILIAAVTDDFDGQTRSSLSPTDIGADAGNYGPTGIDMKASALVAPIASGCKTATESVSVSISNLSTNSIDFSVNNVTVSVTATGGYSSSTILNTGTLAPGASQTVVLPNTIDMTTSGTYTFNASTSVSGDVNTSNDAMLANSITIISLGGTYTVGSGGTYTTLTSAVTAFNNCTCVTSPIVFSLTNTTYTSGENFPIIINNNASLNSTNNLIIKPASNVVASITGSVASGALIRLNGADYVTIDGSNSGGTDKSLTFSNTSTTNAAGIWIASLGTGSGAENNAIKNCIINVNTSLSQSTTGISISGSTLNSTGADNDNITIQNNTINSPSIGIYAFGTAAVSAGGLDNLSIQNNTILTGSSTASPLYGIQVSNAINAQVNSNILNLSTTQGTTPVAISIDAGVTNSVINNNQVVSCTTSSTGGYGGRGIVVGSGIASSNITISNNFIAGVNGSNFSSFGNSSAAGIMIGVTGNSSTISTTIGGVSILNNSINMTGSYSYSASCFTAGVYIGSGATSVSMINNLIVNSLNNTNSSGTGSKAYTIYSAAPSSAFSSINYNNYFVLGTQGVLGFLTSDQSSLANMITAFGGNANSLNIAPTFTSSTDLHLNPAANCSLDNKGTYIAAVTTDIDGASRSNSTPDIGADEFTFSGANVTWTGGTSNVVTNTANWAGGILPSTCSNVIIQSGSANYPSYTTLTIDPGTTYTLQSGAQLTISGTLTNNGTLTLESGATLVQGASSTVAGSGTFNVQQAITGSNNGSAPNGRFWYLGSPVATASSSVYFGNTANVVKKRDEVNNTWTSLSSGTPENLVVGQGYYTQAMANSTINFTGGAVNNGDITISGLSRTAGLGFEGFNLVSNPYPSYLNWDNVVKTEVSNTMWYRTFNSTNNTMVFDTYVAGTNGIGTNLNGAGVSNLIPPMQSFWVRVNPNANPSLNNTGSLGLTNSMRAHFTSINGSVAGLKSTANERDLFLRMNLLQANKKDQLIVYVNEQATNGFDILDGEKMMQAGYPQFYTKAGDKKIVINGLNSAKKQQALPVTIELPTTGVHTFIIEDLEISNGLVWLEDKQEEIIQALEPGTVYEFYANAGLNAERFVLHFQLIDDAVPTNVYNEVNSSANFSGKGASVYAESAGVVVIKLPASAEGVTDIQIRDAAGKLVYAGSMNNLETSVELAQANGIYYVTLSSNTGVEVRKVFIQQ